MLALIKKHRERAALIGLGIGFLLLVGGGIYLQKQNRKAESDLHEVEIKKVELRARPGKSSSSKKEGEKTVSPSTSAFYLRPSPGELLEQLAGLTDLREDVAQKKFLKLRVIWPVYFFTAKEEADGRGSVQFDVSEDGFGVVVVGAINLDAYPELKELTPGMKLWVGGEIIGVDFSGTGTIHLNIEQVDLSPDGPLTQRNGTASGQ